MGIGAFGAVNQNLARSRRHQSGRTHSAHHVEQGALATTRGTEQDIDSGAVEIEVDSVDDARHPTSRRRIFLHNLLEHEADRLRCSARLGFHRAAHRLVSQG